MPIAVIAFDFDPLLRLGDGLAVRWQTAALVAMIAAGLIATGLAARRTGLRMDDLLFIVVAAVPGAIVGGRLGYLLLHLDFYGSHSEAILDPAQGSLELALAVVGGVLSGSYVAALLGAPIGTWLRTLALPLLFVLGAGKLVMVAGGAGQGRPADLPWATAYLGPGPWSSLAPELPSHPSQAYEGIAALGVLLVLTLALSTNAVQARDSRIFFASLGAWAVARAALATTWRDPAVLGGINAGSLVAIAVALGCGLAWVVVARRRPRSRAVAEDARAVQWADPETRPRF